MEVKNTAVSHMCHGVISSVITDSELYEVQIHKSPIGPLAGPVVAIAAHSPGLQGNYKQGDFVKVLMTFTAGGVTDKIIGVQPGSQSHILGLYNEFSLANIKVDNPLTQHGEDRLNFVNKNNGAGISIGDNGDVKVASAGAVHTIIKAFGYGLQEDIHQTWAQNHARIIANNSPFYLAMEQFGMFTGSDDEDKISKNTDEDNFLIFRRFITQSRSPSNWVSTCEGTSAPFVGPNNNIDTISINKEVLLTKIINHGSSRVTVEAGEPGESFVNLRIDDVIKSEGSLPLSPVGATPASLGNRFKMMISDKGAVDIRAAGNGVAQSSMNGFHLSISESGDLKVHSKGSITFTHGDDDVTNNSITLDPNKGIDIKAKNGFRVNGLELVTKKFLEWMNANKTMLCQVTSIGGPAPIHPSILPDFLKGVEAMNENNGFTTKNTGVAAKSIIKDTDDFTSI